MDIESIITFIVLISLLVIKPVFAVNMKVGKTYTVNVDMCVYETANAATRANDAIATRQGSAPFSLEAVDFLSTFAGPEFAQYSEKAGVLQADQADALILLRAAVDRARQQLPGIQDETERKHKTLLLDGIANMIRSRSEQDVFNECKKIGYGTKFEILNNTSDDYYVIKLIDLYDYYENIDGLVTEIASPAVTHVIYYLNKNNGDSNVKTSDLVYSSFDGLSSGPLVVPFKYRSDDKSISGEVAVGYYIGYAVPLNWISDKLKTVSFTPIASIGVSQISVAETTGTNNEIKTENRTGFTWAVGFLLNNWDGVNVGLVYGQDRIGDSTWEHEGKPWYSVSIGWDI